RQRVELTAGDCEGAVPLALLDLLRGGVEPQRENDGGDEETGHAPTRTAGECEGAAPLARRDLLRGGVEPQRENDGGEEETGHEPPGIAESGHGEFSFRVAFGFTPRVATLR